MLRSIKAFFPIKIHEDMAKFTGNVKEKLEQVYSYITDLRESAQNVLKDLDDNVATSGSGGNTGSGSGGRNNTAALADHVKFKYGSRYEDCRICKKLDSEGETIELYEDHYSSLVIGCPRFASMSTEERRRYVDLAQICRFCLDGQYVHKKGARHPNCPPFVRPQNYTCRTCKDHYLVCIQHVDANKDKMEKNNKFWTDRDKVFSNVSIISVMTSPPPSPPSVSSVPNVPQPVSGVPSGVTVNNVQCNRGIMEATNRLKKLAKGLVRDIPVGEPLFMFSYIPGKSRDLICFYDLGCSHCLIKTDVPGEQLDAVMTRPGPLLINAAADVTVPVRDEYAVLVKLTDGSNQIILGVTCDKITSTFPKICTKAAYKDLVDSSPANMKTEVANIKVPDEVGGDPDLLLGVFYASCHPEVLYTMPSGLFIGRLKLASSHGYTGIIGGPHSSFAQLANHVGDTVKLMSYFIDGIKDYKKVGPPKLPIMSHDQTFCQITSGLAEQLDVTSSNYDLADNGHIDIHNMWNIVIVPTPIPHPVWFKTSIELGPNDIVYFRKVASDLSGEWTVGQVEHVIRSKDGVIRRANISYNNAGEGGPKYTDRAVRSLVMESLTNDQVTVDPIRISRSQSGTFNIVARSVPGDGRLDKCDQCCCGGHCVMSHYPGAKISSHAPTLVYVVCDASGVVTMSGPGAGGKMPSQASALMPDEADFPDEAILCPEVTDEEIIQDAAEVLPDVYDDVVHSSGDQV